MAQRCRQQIIPLQGVQQPCENTNRPPGSVKALKSLPSTTRNLDSACGAAGAWVRRFPTLCTRPTCRGFSLTFIWAVTIV